MSDFSTLAEGFQHDAWANSLWVECLKAKGFPQPDTGILEHVLAAGAIWYQRCLGFSPSAMPKVELTVEEIHRAAEKWVSLLDSLPEDRIVGYRNTKGEPFSTELSQIASHVLNHGSYHRGELRGMCRLREDTEFPETDRILFSLSVR